MKISFHSYANKTNVHIERFALSLAFIMKFTTTWKWPIAIVVVKAAFLIVSPLKISPTKPKFGPLKSQTQTSLRQYFIPNKLNGQYGLAVLSLSFSVSSQYVQPLYRQAKPFLKRKISSNIKLSQALPVISLQIRHSIENRC